MLATKCLKGWILLDIHIISRHSSTITNVFNKSMVGPDMSVYWKETQFFPQKPDKLMKTPRGRHEDLPLSKSSKGVTEKEQVTSSARLGKGRVEILVLDHVTNEKGKGKNCQFANSQRMQGQGNAWTRIGSMQLTKWRIQIQKIHSEHPSANNKQNRTPGPKSEPRTSTK